MNKLFEELKILEKYLDEDNYFESLIPGFVKENISKNYYFTQISMI